MITTKGRQLRPDDRARKNGVNLALAVVGLFLVLVAIRPASPFEWDEVLFLRALDSYDAAANAPHMPGYPLFVLLAGLFNLLTRDEILATQLCSILFGVLLVPALWALVRELGLTRRQAAATAVVTVAVPSFLWFAPVGLSDVPGATLGVVTAYLVARSARSRSLWLAGLTGAAGAAAIGVRSQSVSMVVILAIIYVAGHVREKKLYSIVVSAASFAVASAAIWIPAVILTGPGRWWRALVWQLNWVRAERLEGFSVPHAEWSRVIDAWLVSAFGASPIALGFWLAVGVGFGALWVRGQRHPAVFCLTIGLVPLLVSAWGLNLRNGPRYLLPMIPFFAILASGLIPESKSSRFRGVAVVWLAAIALSGILWTVPILWLRSTESSPVWSALEWVAAHHPRDGVVVLHSPKIMPHANWVLARQGYEIAPLSADREALSGHDRRLLRVDLPRKKTPDDALFFEEWPPDRIESMIPRRLYLKCSVTEVRQ
jgi:hypothetical protein